MKKRLFELIITVIICVFFSTLITASYAAKKPFLDFAASNGPVDTVLLWAVAMTFAFVIALSGYVFGVSRGRGKMLSAEDLIPNKPFKIIGMESLNHSRETLISIEINGTKKRCSYLSSVPPKDATHVQAVLEGSGVYEFEFIKITPEVIERVQ